MNFNLFTKQYFNYKTNKHFISLRKNIFTQLFTMKKTKNTQILKNKTPTFKAAYTIAHQRLRLIQHSCIGPNRITTIGGCRAERLWKPPTTPGKKGGKIELRENAGQLTRRAPEDANSVECWLIDGFFFSIRPSRAFSKGE